jgi:hypothetical protein
LQCDRTAEREIGDWIFMAFFSPKYSHGRVL